MATKTRPTYATATFTCPPEWGTDAGKVVTADVVKQGKTYADVQWRESGRTERVRFADSRGIVFREAEQSTDYERDEECGGEGEITGEWH